METELAQGRRKPRANLAVSRKELRIQVSVCPIHWAAPGRCSSSRGAGAACLPVTFLGPWSGPFTVKVCS